MKGGAGTRLRHRARSELTSRRRVGLAQRFATSAGWVFSYDETCQIELGKALAASHILRTNIARFGSVCVLNGELIDLASEVSVAAASAQGPCEGEIRTRARDARPVVRSRWTPRVDVPERAYVEGMLGVYEKRQVELLRDVFVWAYERSCGRYLVIKDDVAAPDPVRIRNHEALRAIVGDIVRSLQRPTRGAVTALAEPLVREGDRARFIEMALDDLALLHEGNVARYRLRLSEYLAWIPVRAASAP